MALLASIRRRAAVLAVAGGVTVFGAALGGMTTVDAELRAVAPLETGELMRVSDVTTAPPCSPDAADRDLAREL